MPIKVGSRLAHYDVTALIGEGGMGQVYQATDTKLNRQVALKILPEVDVWVAAHGSQYGLHDKYEAGQDYDPETFVDPEGFLTEIERLEKLYLDQLAAERR